MIQSRLRQAEIGNRVENDMKKILVPLALPAGPDAGLAVGAYFAEACNASLVLLHVVRRRSLAEPVSLLDPIHRQAEVQLIATANPLRLRVPVEIAVRPGDPAEAIVKETRRSEVHAIVMSTHGCRGWRKWLHRDTAGQVLKSATCPVWLVAPGKNDKTFSLTLANWSSARPAFRGPNVLAFAARVLFPGLKDAGGMARIIFNLKPASGAASLNHHALSSALQHPVRPFP